MTKKEFVDAFSDLPDNAEIVVLIHASEPLRREVARVRATKGNNPTGVIEVFKKLRDQKEIKLMPL